MALSTLVPNPVAAVIYVRELAKTELMANAVALTNPPNMSQVPAASKPGTNVVVS
jgi:hypothetical protein